MKRWTITLLAVMFAMGMPMVAMAMSHESHEDHDHGKSEEMMHKGHEMEGHGDMKHDDQGEHKGHDMHKEDAEDKAKDMHKGHEMHMDHAKDKAHDMHKGHEMEGHGDMKHDMHGGFMEIGESESKGVKAVASIKTYDEETIASMKKMGMDGTHHLMVSFTDVTSGDEIIAGTVAVKVKGPGDSKSKAVKLMQMGGGFGADIALTEKGHYDIEVGSKLQDGEKRQFKFQQMVE